MELIELRGCNDNLDVVVCDDDVGDVGKLRGVAVSSSFFLSNSKRCSNGKPAPIGSGVGAGSCCSAISCDGSSVIGGGLFKLDGDVECIGGDIADATPLDANRSRSSFSCFSLSNLLTMKMLNS